FFFSSRRRHTRFSRDWSSDVALPILDNKPAIIPPQNTDAEASLLGALLIDTDALVRVADKIATDDFYEPRHQLIYQAILDLYERSEERRVGQEDRLRGSQEHRELKAT